MADLTPQPGIRTASLPPWARELATLYESNASNQFILYGNVYDRMLLPLGAQAEIGTLIDFLLRAMMPQFDVILSYDLGNGIRVEKGEPLFNSWPQARDNPDLLKVTKAPKAAVELLTQFFRYSANLQRLQHGRIQVGCLIKAADLVAPALRGGFSYELSALALLIRDWSTDSLLTEHPFATFLIAENLNDLHPQLTNNTRAAQVRIPLPSPADLQQAFAVMARAYPTALSGYQGDFTTPASQLAGATLGAIEALLKTKEHNHDPLDPEDLVQLKKELVERDCNGLIEFIESTNTLDDIYGQEKLKAWLRQDVALWKRNDVEALPMGYLLCGPVGTGKTFMVRCLAGEAGVPVVRFKNFRDKWVGSTEGNLEKIFRLLHALGRAFVFIDEADQALGQREGGSGDSGVSNRVYSMMAEEMSDTRNRGQIIWVLASSRPDLIEVDLKRPGRVDVKIPIFPTTTVEESFALIRALCRKRRLDIPETEFEGLKPLIPLLMTPGAAEALAVKVYRIVCTASRSPVDALRDCLDGYQNPVPLETMKFQIELALREASDLDFVPPAFRPKTKP